MPISPPPPPRALALLGLLCLVLVASWPSWGSLGSGLVSDDGAALGYAHRASSPWLDWTGAQYDLASVRFWRPMVTTSLALQERMSGVAPVPLRLFNLLGHVVTAILLALVARELGAGRFGSLLTGLLAGLFPDQGGTVTWIVGRVDSLAAPLAVGALLAALRGRGWLAGLATLAACATKEIAFVLPVWVALGALGAGRKPAAALRATSPVALAAGLAFLARRQALGTWIGGYTQVGRPELDLLACAQAWSEVVWPALLLLAGAVAIGLIAGNAHPRAWACALGVALVAALPLAHVLGVGEVEDVHRRTLWFSDLGLCLACGLALGRAREPSRARAPGAAGPSWPAPSRCCSRPGPTRTLRR